MKIVFTDEGIYAYASGSPNAVGGSERQQWLLARALASNHWTVLVAVNDGIPAGGLALIDQVTFVGIGPGRGHILEAWHRFLSSERPEWWYWRSANHVLGLGVELAKLRSVRTIFAAAFDSDVHPARALSRKPQWWPLYAWGLKRVDRILVQHGGQLRNLASPWQSKAHIVPSIVRIADPMKPHSDRSQYVAWVGMLRQPKRPDVLVEIAQRMPTCHFVVCGAPTLHRSLPGYGERIVKMLRALPNVDYLGQVAPDKAEQVIADAAVLLSTSEGEGFPNTYLQAWSRGTPVVSMKIDPDNSIDRVGLGTVATTIGDAIAAIHALIGSPKRREEIAVRARAHVTQQHCEAVAVAAFEHAVQGAHLRC
jgi:glycosyltransferase involved in cell wall biosynthesis